MPLLIDPLDPQPKRTMRLAVLMIPALVSVLTLLVILFCWSIPDAFPGLAAVSCWKNVFYYLLATGLFIYGNRRIKMSIENYSDYRRENETENP